VILFVIYMLIKMLTFDDLSQPDQRPPQKASQLYNASLKSGQLKL